MLERIRSYVRSKLQHGERSAVNHLDAVRSVFSHAIRDKIVDPKHYPFGKGKVKIKFPDSNKGGLSPEEVIALEKVELTEPKQNHACNLWLLSFYFAGMRFSDVLRMKWLDIRDNRLYYSIGKNNKGESLKVAEKALNILKQCKAFKETKDDLIFSELKGFDLKDSFLIERKIMNKVSAIDKVLRDQVAPKIRIDKKLTMHIARHTFGNISGDKIPIQMLQKLYRHFSITTTIGYQSNFIKKDTDDALETIIKLDHF